MKTARIIASSVFVLALAPSTAAFAAGEPDSRPSMSAPAAASDKLADGVVKKVNRATGRITLAHGPLLNLGMPAMTMEFAVKDKAWLKPLKEGARVRFIADRVDGAFAVIRLEPAADK